MKIISVWERKKKEDLRVILEFSPMELVWVCKFWSQHDVLAVKPGKRIELPGGVKVGHMMAHIGTIPGVWYTGRSRPGCSQGPSGSTSWELL